MYASGLTLEALASEAVMDSVEAKYGSYQEPQISQNGSLTLVKSEVIGWYWLCERGKTGEKSVDSDEGGKCYARHASC